MARLSSMPARLATLKPRVASATVDGARAVAVVAHWKGWYALKRWRRLRWQVLLEARFTCARCSKIEGVTRNLVADHIRPHRGDEALFWDRANLQCLCKPCHDSAKKREEAAGPHAQGGRVKSR
jgi:5-methylcytosine-specific restriction endonuclease McrA